MVRFNLKTLAHYIRGLGARLCPARGGTSRSSENYTIDSRKYTILFPPGLLRLVR